MSRLLAICLGLAAIIVSLSGCAASPSPPRAEVVLADACRYLWSQQAGDGGWHSPTHGLLKGGQAWTPFVLHTLMNAPSDACPQPEGGTTRALIFLRERINEEGVLGLADPDILEYPNYATAYALRVFVQAGTPEDSMLIGRMAAYLVEQQFVEARGFDRHDAAYGSWGFGEQHLPPGRTGHIDLSHTRRVLQTLHAAGRCPPDVFWNAAHFLQLAQKHPLDPRLYPPGNEASFYDGGFYASPVVPGVNKSMRVPEAPDSLAVYASYATATADGVLALLAAGIEAGDERVQAAAQWLRMHPRLDEPAGLPVDDPAGWHRVLFFYHLAVRAEAYAALQEPGGWPQEIAHLLADRQHAAGYFTNPYGAPNKEDDPILATALAVQALTHAMEQMRAET